MGAGAIQTWLKLCLTVFQNDFRVAYRLPWRLTEVPFLKFNFVPGVWLCLLINSNLVLNSLGYRVACVAIIRQKIFPQKFTPLLKL